MFACIPTGVMEVLCMVWLLSWVDDYLVIGPKDEVMRTKAEMMGCEEIGELKEYVDAKLTMMLMVVD